MASGSTTNFSLSYPISTDNVDIHGDIQALADDVDTQLLNFTAKVSPSTDHGVPRFDGVTGVLQDSGVLIDDSNNLTIPGDLTIGSTGTTIATITGSSGVDRYAAFSSGGSKRFSIVGADSTAESGSNAGSNFRINRFTDAGAYAGTALTITRSTGDATFESDVTVTGNLDAAAITGDSLRVDAGAISVDLTGAGANATLELKTDAAKSAAISFRTGSSTRWSFQKNGTAESGGNAGSDLVLYSYDDAGSFIGTALSINRATMDTTLGGSLTTNANIFVDRVGQATTTSVQIDGDAGYWRALYYKTGGLSRWAVVANASAESGSNVGSDFSIVAYDDAGSSLGSAMTINRSSQAVNFFGNVKSTGTISSDLGFYLYRPGASAYYTSDRDAGQYGGLNFKTGGVNRWIFAADNAAESGSNAGSDIRLLAYNDAGGSLGTYLQVFRSTGYILIPGVYNNTTASAASVHVTSAGQLQRSTSSIKYKENVENSTLSDSYNVVNNLRPVRYDEKDANDGVRHWGFIAEEVVDVDPTLVTFDDQGKPDGMQYSKVVPALVQVIKDQGQRIAALEAQLS